MTLAASLAALLAGLALGFSTIIAIGAQNAFVLRQGLRRQHVTAIVTICVLSDVVLIALGIAGIGLLLRAVPWLMTAIRIAGAVFLAGYGLLAARRARRGQGGALEAAPASASPRRTLLAAVATTLAVTWLNPHVYLDIALIGALANGHGDARWLFGAGVALASLAWFAALGFGARALAPLFARPLAWRILDGAIAVLMLALAVTVVLPLLPSGAPE